MPCTNEDPFDSGRPSVFGRLGGGSVSPDGTAHFRGHFDGRSLASGAEVTLFVTSHSMGSIALTGTSVLEFLTPHALNLNEPTIMSLSDGNPGSVVALSVFRVP
jgi:hypothetical protein